LLDHVRSAMRVVRCHRQLAPSTDHHFAVDPLQPIARGAGTFLELEY
jgi:hypothetical protein